MAREPNDSYLKLVPDDYLQRVGLVVTQWSWSELIIEQYIWRLLGVRAMRGRVVTAALTTRQKIEMLAALMRKSRMKESFIKEVEDEGKALSELRNLIAHGSIVVTTGPPQLAFLGSFHARGELKERSKRISLDILLTLARRIATYLGYLIDQADQLPKQRGLRSKPALEGPTTPRRRTGTTRAQRLLPLEVERQRGPTDEEMAASRAEKKARKAAHRQRSLDGEKKS